VNIQAPVLKYEDERHTWEEWDDCTIKVEEKPKLDPIRDLLSKADTRSDGLIPLQFSRNTSYAGRDYGPTAPDGAVALVDRWWAYVFLKQGRAVISKGFPNAHGTGARRGGTRASGQKKGR
jgi:hypothetical protein